MSLLRIVSLTLVALVALLAGSACIGGDGEPDAPPAPTTDGDSDRDPRFGPGPRTTQGQGTAPPVFADGGSTDPGAGEDFTFLGPGCIAIGANDPDNFARVFEEGAAVPFPVSAAFARVAADARGDETLLIALTDGACERGVGRQLELEADVGAIGRDVVVGDNALRREPSPLRVRFNDFSDPAVPAIFGTCTEASGTITFGEIATSEGALQRATFPGIRLGSCSNPAAGARSRFVEGGFAVPLP